MPWRLFRIQLRASLLNDLQYRSNFLLEVATLLVSLVISLAGLGIVFSQTESLAGWGPDELLVVVGVYWIVSSLYQMSVEPSLQKLLEDVQSGELDFALTKPVDTQVLVAVQRVQSARAIDFIIGLGILGVGALRLRDQIDLLDVLLFVVLLIAGVVMLCSFLFLLATTVFWFINLDNIFNIFGGMFEAGQWPIFIYPRWMQIGLTVVVPIGFAITVPAAALTNRLTPGLFAGAIALAVVLPLLARWFWLKGLRRYAGASA